ncbi:hypothetical protein [Stutzerimonas marianensis]
MNTHVLLLAIGLLLTGNALATGTGPTLPEKSRDHPLDNREPRQEVIEQPREDESSQPRPPTLESPPAVPPVEPTERRAPGTAPEHPSGEAVGPDDSTPSS